MARDAISRLKVVYRDPRKLIPDEANSRTHSDEQIRQIRASIEEFGFTNPVLLRDDGKTIGAGHGRQEAALLDPPIKSIPTIIVPNLTEDQWRAYVIADNKIALNAGWNEDLLRVEIAELKAINFNIDLLGFSAHELKALEPVVIQPPDQFKAYGDGINTEHSCPSCGYKWSGKQAAGPAK